ncbi:MAG: hypothetical protein AAB351_01690 [Patescibacteria group bacterium]
MSVSDVAGRDNVPSSATPNIRHDDGQGLEFHDALVRAGLTRHDRQHVISSKGNLVAQSIVMGIRVVAQQERDLKWRDPRAWSVSSDCGYPESLSFRSHETQVRVYKQLFGNLDGSHVDQIIRNTAFPEEADLWAVIPKPWVIAEDVFSAMRLMVEKLSELGIVVENKAAYEMDEAHMHLITKMQMFYAKQHNHPGDFIVLPVQFGKNWAGHSLVSSKAQHSIEEFSLDPYAILALLYTHPERLRGEHQELGIRCGGVLLDRHHDDHDEVTGDHHLCFRWFRDGLLISADHGMWDREAALGIPTGFDIDI